jgi:NADH:quinone reductase (non-electrogenic)
VAEAIKAHVAGEGEPPPFRYRKPGQARHGRPQGGRHRVGRLRLKGWPAWWIWGIAYIYFLISLRNRLIVATQ